jgi:hypothetical protein
MTQPIARYVIHLCCPYCNAGFYAAVPFVLPLCPVCAGGRLRPCGVWELTTEASPASVSHREASALVSGKR